MIERNKAAKELRDTFREHDPCDVNHFVSDRQKRRLLSAALKEERERLQKTMDAVCPECGPVEKCDEDGCCLYCGMDVLVGWGLKAWWEEERGTAYLLGRKEG